MSHNGKAYAAGDVNTLHLFRPTNSQQQQMNAQVNRTNRSGEYPLIATEGGQKGAVSVLSDHATVVDARSGDDATALVEACRRGHAEMVSSLIQKGTNVSICNKTGLTPLYAAAVAGYVKVVELLLQNGADPDTTNLDGTMPLHQTCIRGPTEIPIMLLSYGANPNTTNCRLSTPLRCACSREDGGAVELVERLLESGADVNARSEFKTPLHLACALSKLDLIELLVHRGADVKLIETELQRYNINTLRKLHECGCQVPLLAILASRREYQHMQSCLQCQKVDLNMVDDKGVSPLQHVLNADNFQMAKTLLLMGASAPKVTCTDEKSPLHDMTMYHPEKSSAAMDLRFELAMLLVLNGADINALCLTSVLSDDSASLDRRVETFVTPLHVAMQSRFIPCVQFLLDHGASYEHMVTREGNIETRKSIWQMCDENPDLIRIFGTGWTPANHQLHPECIRKAVRCGDWTKLRCTEYVRCFLINGL